MYIRGIFVTVSNKLSYFCISVACFIVFALSIQTPEWTDRHWEYRPHVDRIQRTTLSFNRRQNRRWVKINLPFVPCSRC